MPEWFIIKDYPKYTIFNDGKVFSDYSFKFLRHCKDDNGSYVRLYKNKQMRKSYIKDLLKEYFNKDESNCKKNCNSKPLYMRECLIK